MSHELMSAPQQERDTSLYLLKINNGFKTCIAHTMHPTNDPDGSSYPRARRTQYSQCELWHAVA